MTGPRTMPGRDAETEGRPLVETDGRDVIGGFMTRRAAKRWADSKRPKRQRWYPCRRCRYDVAEAPGALCPRCNVPDRVDL